MQNLEDEILNGLVSLQECAHVVTELLCIGPAAGINPGVLPLVLNLEALLQDSPPPVELIRHPRVLLLVPIFLVSSLLSSYLVVYFY